MRVRIVAEEVALPDGRTFKKGDIIESDEYPTLFAAGIAEAVDAPRRSGPEAMIRK